MSNRKRLPVALTIAGSDSGGGAGIQADLKTFASLGLHGASVVTCVTAQNPKRVLGIQACAPATISRQLEAVFAELPPAAVKTGMLYSVDIIRVVVKFFNRGNLPPLVVDPVMMASSGTRLLQRRAIQFMQDALLPLAAVVTPNLHEAEILSGKKLTSLEDLRAAAKAIRRQFGCAALVKGGHLRGTSEAADIFYDGAHELLLTAPFVAGVQTHGTGCVYSAAITGYLALGTPLAKAVPLAKQYITQAVAQGRLAGGHFVLNSFWRA